MNLYAGIGSRETPADVCDRMTRLALVQQQRGFILRSGGAQGADEAFERGAGDLKEIWLPWLGWRGHTSKLVPTEEAFALAEHFHPAWHRCTEAARCMHARNMHQVLGRDLETPVDYVICWTPDGKASGGTGQAIRVAEHFRIPVLNLYHVQLTSKPD